MDIKPVSDCVVETGGSGVAALQEVWAKGSVITVLGLAGAGVSDNWFGGRGHSTTATTAGGTEQWNKL